MTVLRTVLIAALFFVGAGTLAMDGWLTRIHEKELVGLEAELDGRLAARRDAQDQFDSVVYQVLYGAEHSAVTLASAAEEPRQTVQEAVATDEVVVSVTFAAFLEEHAEVFEAERTEEAQRFAMRGSP